jgi:hypothetical protein
MRLVAILFMLAVGCGGYQPCMGPGCGTNANDGGALDLAGVDGLQPFLGRCTRNEDCESNLCGDFPAKGGGFCTRRCTMATAGADCPPPSTGCNNMGLCKVP